MKRIWIPAALLEEIHDEAKSAARLETGGILAGHHITGKSGDEAVITQIIGPGPGSQHLAASFTPDASWQADQLARLYESSGRTLSYLGDWHSHPGGSCEPSSRDLRTLRHIARFAKARCPSPIMGIVGQTPQGSRFHVVRYIRDDWKGRPVVSIAHLAVY